MEVLVWLIIIKMIRIIMGLLILPCLTGQLKKYHFNPNLLIITQLIAGAKCFLTVDTRNIGNSSSQSYIYIYIIKTNDATLPDL